MRWSATTATRVRSELLSGLILDGLERVVGCELRPERLTLPGGAHVDVDGVAIDGLVLVEVFTHQGPLKGGQRHKIATDALKLITIARDRAPRPRLVLAFAEPKRAEWAAGESWLAAALTRRSTCRSRYAVLPPRPTLREPCLRPMGTVALGSPEGSPNYRLSTPPRPTQST